MPEHHRSAPQIRRRTSGRVSLNLDQIATYFPNIGSRLTFVGERASDRSNDFEIVYQGSQNDLTNIPLRRVALIRERQPWLTANGKWARVYGLPMALLVRSKPMTTFSPGKRNTSFRRRTLANDSPHRLYRDLAAEMCAIEMSSSPSLSRRIQLVHHPCPACISVPPRVKYKFMPSNVKRSAILLPSIVRSIPRSGIRDFFDIVQSMDNVVSPGIGEPGFVTPWHIREPRFSPWNAGAPVTLPISA